MESSQVQEMIGSEVYWEAKKMLADIVGYEKGWVTIKDDNGNEHKVRAKELVLMGTEDDLVETDEGLATQEANEDPSTSSSVQSSPKIEKGDTIHCSCGHEFEAPAGESFKCPECGKWFEVRLHPDLDRYVKGLGETASGRDTVDINDDVADQLRGMDLDSLYDFACDKLMELDPDARFSKSMKAAFNKSGLTCGDFLRERYEDRNAGMQRMNVGNLLRGAFKRQEVLNAQAEAKAQAKADK